MNISKSNAFLRGYLFFIIMLPGSAMAINDENLYIHGSIVKHACNLLTDENMNNIDFGSIVDTFLYKNLRTPPKNLNVSVVDCEVDILNTLMFSINGDESVEYQGNLSIAANGDASGITIGFESLNKDNIKLNSKYRIRDFSSDYKNISIFSYVAATPESIKNRDIQKGSFNAIAYLNIYYD